MAGSIANLAVKLSLDGAGYESGLKMAESSTRRWGGSLDSIIEKMERQSQGVEESSRRAAIFAAAQKGANSQTVAYALALDAELNSLERLQQAEVDEAMAKERAKAVEDKRVASIQSLISTAERQTETFGMTSQQLQIYELRQLGATDAEIQHTISLHGKVRALMDAKEAEQEAAQATAQAIAIEKQRTGSIQGVLSSLQRTTQTYGMSSRQLQIYQLKELGATEAEIKHAMALQMKIRGMEQADRLTKHLAQSSQQLGSAVNGASQSLGAGAGAMNKSILVTQSLIYGVEDAATVYGDQGLRGAIRASMNNFVMAGMIMSPQIGLMVALASTALQLGMAFTKSAEGTGEQTKALEELEKRLDASAAKYDEMISRRNKLDNLSSSEEAAKASGETGQDIWKNQKLLEEAQAERAKILEKYQMGGVTIGITDEEDIKRLDEAEKAVKKYEEQLTSLEKHQKDLAAAKERLKGEEKIKSEMELSLNAGAKRLEQQKQENERVAQLKKQYEELSEGPLEKYNRRLEELTSLGLSDADLKKNVKLLDEEFLKPSETAQKYMDNAKTPLQKYEDELNKLQESLAKGEITESVYDKNAKLLSDQMLKPENDNFKASTGGAAAAGSADAYKTIAGVITGAQSRDGLTNLNTTAGKQLAEAKKQTTALEEVRKNLGLEEADLGV